MPGGTRVVCVGLDAALADLVGEGAQSALAALDMASALDRLVICADDLVGDDNAWVQPVRGTLGRELTLYCHPDAFLAPRAAAGPPVAVWDCPGPANVGFPAAAGDFSRTRAEVFLHHHLLVIRDLVRRELDPSLVPAGLAEAFAAAWAIGVDGRLCGAGLPGYPLAERRRRFSRLFSQAGILMPEHWTIFQEIWDGVAPGQRDVARLARRLPRL
jgi:hypothetical protein